MKTLFTPESHWYQTHFNILNKKHFEYLKDIALQYAKYEKLFTCFSCHPQKQANDYDPKEIPHFIFQVNDPTEPKENEVWFTVTSKCVLVDYHIDFKDEHFREQYTMTHAKCFEYLDQLPRGWYHFTDAMIEKTTFKEQ